MISNADGGAFQSFLDANPGACHHQSHRGRSNRSLFITSSPASPPKVPSSDRALKPDLDRRHHDMAAESYDPLGELYGANGYTVANGTSFATPMVRGAAAMVNSITAPGPRPR